MPSAEAEIAAAKFLLYFERAKDLHQDRYHRELELYKPTEPDCVVAAFDRLIASPERGLAFAAELLHELVWSQCLDNANHRTSFLFLQAFLAEEGVAVPHYASDADADARLAAAIDRFSMRSKEYLDRRSEWGYGPREFEARHRHACQQWVEELVGGDQSRVPMTVGPQRLISFSS